MEVCGALREASSSGQALWLCAAARCMRPPRQDGQGQRLTVDVADGALACWAVDQHTHLGRGKSKEAGEVRISRLGVGGGFSALLACSRVQCTAGLLTLNGADLLAAACNTQAYLGTCSGRQPASCPGQGRP